MDQIIEMGSFLINVRGFKEVTFKLGDDHASYWIALDHSGPFEVKIVHEGGGIYSRPLLEDDAKWIHEGTYTA